MERTEGRDARSTRGVGECAELEGASQCRPFLLQILDSGFQIESIADCTSPNCVRHEKGRHGDTTVVEASHRRKILQSKALGDTTE